LTKNSSGPIAQSGTTQIRFEVGQSREQAEVRCHRRWQRFGGRFGGFAHELGYKGKRFYFRTACVAHSIAAQGGINAAKIIRTTATAFTAFLRHHQGWRFCAREANVYRSKIVTTTVCRAWRAARGTYCSIIALWVGLQCGQLMRGHLPLARNGLGSAQMFPRTKCQR
jgi:hypothetical protein